MSGIVSEDTVNKTKFLLSWSSQSRRSSFCLEDFSPRFSHGSHIHIIQYLFKCHLLERSSLNIPSTIACPPTIKLHLLILLHCFSLIPEIILGNCLFSYSLSLPQNGSFKKARVCRLSHSLLYPQLPEHCLNPQSLFNK